MAFLWYYYYNNGFYSTFKYFGAKEFLRDAWSSWFTAVGSAIGTFIMKKVVEHYGLAQFTEAVK